MGGGLSGGLKLKAFEEMEWLSDPILDETLLKILGLKLNRAEIWNLQPHQNSLLCLNSTFPVGAVPNPPSHGPSTGWYKGFHFWPSKQLVHTQISGQTRSTFGSQSHQSTTRDWTLWRLSKGRCTHHRPGSALGWLGWQQWWLVAKTIEGIESKTEISDWAGICEFMILNIE